MSGKASRTKGHNFERKIANLLKPLFPNAKRGYQTRFGGIEECDVEGTPFHIECKIGKRIGVPAAIRQMEADCGDREPVLVSKRDREGIYVTMRWDTLYKLLSIRKEHTELWTMLYNESPPHV